MNNKKTEFSKSGDPIFRHTGEEKGWQAPQGDSSIEQISAHIEKHIGEVDTVLHELVSDTVHIDIHYVKPSEQRPFHTLITSGMSNLPMKLPEDCDLSPYMELMVTLPASWQISDEAFKDEQWYWPVRQLKFLARFPHKYDAWLAWGHTIPNGDPAEPFADNTLLNGILLAPSPNVPDDFQQLQINPQKQINFLCLVPLYEEEMNLKLRKGADELITRFDKYDIDDVVDIKRRNVAKKWFGWF